MKKILSLLIILATLISLGAMVGCSSGDDGLPEGMQLVRGSDALGYYFYCPAEWTLSNLGKISAAYASTVDSSSVSYTEFTMPEGSDATSYFTSSLSEFPTMPTNVSAGENYTFGNAQSAIMFTFEYEYSSHKFKVMQIISTFEGRYGLFTFTSLNENISSSETVQFDYYKDKIRQVTDNFKYVSKNGADTLPEYEKDSDGYLLVSDAAISGFSLYLPETFTIDYSSGIVTATAGDGATISMSKATATGVTVDKYWAMRKDELSAVFSDVTEIKINEPVIIGNASRAFSYEYTYTLGEVTYHVYQILAVSTYNGYVFTYTAKEDSYASHLPEIEKILTKVTLK